MMAGKELSREAREVARRELVGLRVSIAASRDARRVGLRGTVVDESMHMLSIETGRGVVLVPKRDALFRFATPRGEVEVPGEALDVRPEDRIKKVR